jgi:putative Mg2+ transporter-C (MgtC) family protein
MINFVDTKMELELLGEVSIYIGIAIQIVFALVLGGLVGYDREVKMKAAGFKTNIMICIGATLYTTISMLNLDTHSTSAMIDPNRVAAQIVSGIGFLGAGAIIQGKGNVTGLTTAATIWVVAAIGYTIGVGYPLVATLFSITVLIILRMLNPVNKMIEKEKDYKNFHIEMLSYGSVRQTIDHILEL